ncbi:hypothetical protein Tco_0660599, partial [Tanacetum coccineum]
QHVKGGKRTTGVKGIRMAGGKGLLELTRHVAATWHVGPTSALWQWLSNDNLPRGSSDMSEMAGGRAAGQSEADTCTRDPRNGSCHTHFTRLLEAIIAHHG